jgi:predicted Zn-dependent protease
VSDSADADVIVRVANPPLKAPSTLARLQAALSECGGATDFNTGSTRFDLRLPIRMYIHPKYDPTLVDLTECFRITATHELGHSLGLLEHSSDTHDIMYFDPQATFLSARDVNTAQYLAHWPANMIPTR